MEPDKTPKPGDTSYQQRLLHAPGVKIGLIGGILGGGIGMAVAIGAVIATHNVAGIVATCVITLLVGGIFWLFLGPLFGAARLARTGIPAEATILRVRDTGVTVNEQPQIGLTLQVRPPTGAPYETDTKAIVSRLQAAWYVPGAKVGVKINPKNPKKVVITEQLDVSSPLGNQAQAAAPDQAKAMATVTEMDQYNQKLMTGGETAKARVKEATPLNVLVNGNNPAMKFLLEVQPIGGEPFLAEAGGVIREDSVRKYEPGCEIWVKLDPTTKTRVGLFHS